MTEIWKEIPSTQGEYLASNLGRIKRPPRIVGARNGKTRRMKENFLGHKSSSTGYMMADLKLTGGRRRLVAIHTLVMEAFVGPRPPKHDVAHNNGEKTDNRLTNLRYATRSENEIDKVRHGQSSRGTQRGKTKLTQSEIIEIREIDWTGKTQKEIAKRYGISQQHVSCIIGRRTWSYL